MRRRFRLKARFPAPPAQFLPISMPAAIPASRLSWFKKRVALRPGLQGLRRAPDLGSPGRSHRTKNTRATTTRLVPQRIAAALRRPAGRQASGREHIKEHQRGREKFRPTRRRSWREPALESFCGPEPPPNRPPRFRAAALRVFHQKRQQGVHCWATRTEAARRRRAVIRSEQPADQQADANAIRTLSAAVPRSALFSSSSRCGPHFRATVRRLIRPRIASTCSWTVSDVTSRKAADRLATSAAAWPDRL